MIHRASDGIKRRRLSGSYSGAQPIWRSGHQWQDIPMGRPSSPDLPLRGGDRAALSNEEMVFSQGLGNKACQANWHEKGKGRHRPQYRRDPNPASGSTAHRSIGCRPFISSWSGSPTSDVPLGRWFVAISFIRLVAARPYPAADVKASAPDIIMRRCATSEGTMTPAMASESNDAKPQPDWHQVTTRAHPVYATAGSDRSSATAFKKGETA
ncbi:hypothetical protein ACVMB0_000067 [Bradyrhizobium sp. USDA 4451]